jgi:hypothetical protein
MKEGIAASDSRRDGTEQRNLQVGILSRDGDNGESDNQETLKLTTTKPSRMPSFTLLSLPSSP